PAAARACVARAGSPDGDAPSTRGDVDLAVVAVWGSEAVRRLAGGAGSALGYAKGARPGPAGVLRGAVPDVPGLRAPPVVHVPDADVVVSDRHGRREGGDDAPR